MESLPDDLLLEVLSYVDTLQLVRGVRAVCRRWRELALSADVWSHRDLCFAPFFQDGQQRVLRQILDVAPRVRRISTLLDVKAAASAEEAAERARTARAMLELASSAPCSARHLEFDLSRDLQIAPEDCVRLVQHHQQRGPLRRLCVRLHCSPAELRPLLEAVAALRLERLEFHRGSIRLEAADGEPGWAEVVSAAPWGRGGATHLDLSGLVRLGQHEGAAEYLNALLGVAAAARVQSLDLSSSQHYFLPLSPLAACASLQELTLTAWRGLPDLLACPRLTRLRLSLVGYPPPPQGAALSQQLSAFFQEATALEELQLQFSAGTFDLASRLLERLANTGRSSLRALTLRCPSVPAVQAMAVLSLAEPQGAASAPWEALPTRLLPALAGLRWLRTLTLDLPWEVPQAALVAALDGLAAASSLFPELEVVALSCRSLSLPRDLPPAVFRLVLAAPRLHVKLYTEAVVLAGPGRVVRATPPSVGLYAHPQEQPCALHDNTVSKWKMINADSPAKLGQPGQRHEVLGPISARRFGNEPLVRMYTVNARPAEDFS